MILSRDKVPTVSADVLMAAQPRLPRGSISDELGLIPHRPEDFAGYDKSGPAKSS
jgi:hypothetical protein